MEGMERACTRKAKKAGRLELQHSKRSIFYHCGPVPEPAAQHSAILAGGCLQVDALGIKAQFGVAQDKECTDQVMKYLSTFLCRHGPKTRLPPRLYLVVVETAFGYV